MPEVVVVDIAVMGLDDVFLLLLPLLLPLGAAGDLAPGESSNKDWADMLMDVTSVDEWLSVKYSSGNLPPATTTMKRVSNGRSAS